MSNQNTDVVRRFLAEASRGNVAVMDEVFAPAFFNHNPTPGATSDLAGYKQTVTAMLAAFPDFAVTVEDAVAEGDKVALRVTIRGTHQGALMGTPPTGKPIAISGMSLWRIADGKIVERWESADMLGLMQQLGVIPSPQ
jgi:steroid delta-isomerase-like uncharacterized protein